MMNFVPWGRPSRPMPFSIDAMTNAPSSARHDATAAAEEARAADHGGGDDAEQQVAAAGAGRDGPGTRGEHDASHAGHEAADHEHEDAHAVDVDPGAPGRLGVAADRVHVAPEAHPRRDERPEHEQDHRATVSPAARRDRGSRTRPPPT